MIIEKTVTEQVCLPKGLFQTHLSNFMKEQLTNHNLPDVTLVSDEQIQIKAHKIVLAACSPVLKDLLMNNSQIDPVLILCDVNYQDLQSLLDFIYLGEIKINRERLNDFLDLSKLLNCENFDIHFKKEGESLRSYGKHLLSEVDKIIDYPYLPGADSDEPQSYLDGNIPGKLTDNCSTNKHKDGNVVTWESESSMDDDSSKHNTETLMKHDPIIQQSIQEDETKNLKDDRVCKEANPENTIPGMLTYRTLASLKKGNFSCNMCGFTARYDANLKKHKETVHEVFDHEAADLKYSCSQCEYQTAEKGHFIYHHNTKHQGVRYPCDQCEYKSKEKHKLKNHIATVHEGVRFYCDQCDFKSTARGVVKHHIESVHEGLRYSCDQCIYQTNRPGNLKKHVQSKHEGIRYPCKECDYKGTEVSSLRNHEKTVHGGLRYYCDQCDYQTKQQHNLKLHIKGNHLGGEQCPICHKQVKNLHGHLQVTHQQGKKHVCSDCGKVFFKACDLKTHIGRVHLGTSTRFTCPECGKSVVKIKDHMKSVHGSHVSEKNRC